MENEKKITLRLDVKGQEKWDKAKDSLKRGVGDSDKQFKQFAKKTLPETNKVLSRWVALTRRATFYRVIGAVFRSVSIAVKDGTKNLYEYSRALNSTDSSKAFNTLNEYKSVILQVKNTIGAGLAPIIQSLLPVVEALANAFIKVFNAVNALFHLFRGDKSFTVATKFSADKLASANKSAKELKKTLFGFDELNVLNAPNNGGSGFSTEDYKNMFKEMELTDEFKEKLKAKLTDTQKMIGGYSLLLGMTLALAGKIPLGIGLMAVGATSIIAASSLNWDELGSTVGEKIQSITNVVSGAMLAIGAILALSGIAVPLGIGLIAAGAIGFTVSSVDWNSTTKSVSDQIALITAIASGAALALGIMLALTGNVPLGMGLIAIGAAGIFASANISDKISGIIKTILGTIVSVASGFSLALGLILLCNPGTMGLGLGLVFAGLIGGSTAYTLTSNPIVDFVTGLINGILKAFQDGVNDIINLINAVTRELNNIPGINIRELSAFKIRLIGEYSEIPGARQDFQPRATGGMVLPGSMFLAGERGAELITATSNGVNVSTRDQIADSVASGNEGIINALFAVANQLTNTINSQDYGSDVYIGDRDIVRAYDRGKRLMGNKLVEV